MRMLRLLPDRVWAEFWQNHLKARSGLEKTQKGYGRIMTRSHLFTSESVALGHPDKLADTISDSVLDAILVQDPRARVACETMLTNGLVLVGGEITTEAYVDIADIARRTIVAAGYNDSRIGLDGDSVGVTVSISQQSPEIAAGVFNALEGRDTARDEVESLGAGDQGIVFGYANSDNTAYFPVAAKLAHLLTARLAEERLLTPGEPLLLPDAKAQVTIRYEDHIPVAIDNVLISTQHSHVLDLAALQHYVRDVVIKPVIELYNEQLALHAPLIDEGRYLINPAGEWHVGGPRADAGLTGRKIIVDSYCGYARHGGGAYSGKDPSKTDRSGAYALRHAAKNLVAAGAAEELELQVAYAIGSSQPVSIHVDTRGRRSVGATKIEGIINELFDLRPGAILRDLQLREHPIYALTAQNGHFGRNPDDLFSWERLDRIEEIQALL
jgi:S-adenosylmethionine synthetase